MDNKLTEFVPNNFLQRYIDAYWFFRNTSENKIYFPVVPDGCSDIIFYLNDSKKLGNLKSTFVTGIMEYAQLISIPTNMEFFGIRFKPSILFYVLKTDMRKITNSMSELSQFNKNIVNKLKIDPYAKNESIVLNIENQIERMLEKIDAQDNFLKSVEKIIENPSIGIEDIQEEYGLSLKTLQRNFYKKIGLSPKKFARIMRFQKAHKKISKEGLKNLVVIALSSGYFDQAHFNREYKKLVGYNPSNATMSILYNK